MIHGADRVRVTVTSGTGDRALAAGRTLRVTVTGSDEPMMETIE